MLTADEVSKGGGRSATVSLRNSPGFCWLQSTKAAFPVVILGAVLGSTARVRYTPRPIMNNDSTSQRFEGISQVLAFKTSTISRTVITRMRQRVHGHVKFLHC